MFMKKFLTFAVGVAALIVAMPAMAQTAQPASEPATTPVVSCAGNICPGTGGVIIDVMAGAGHAGDFRAMWNGGTGGTGSATATKEGGAYSVFDIVYDSCNTGTCGAARVTANVGGYEIGESMATASAPTAGQWAIAQNTGTALTAGQLIVTMVRPPAPTTTHTQNGQ
jgi:hypothetical protein